MSTKMSKFSRTFWCGALVGVLLAGAFALMTFAAPIMSAQQAAGDARWQAWLGCWEPADVAAGTQAPVRCVVPAANRPGVDVVSIADGKETSREAVDATGEQRPVSADGCNGWEQATWSADGRRVYLRSELACAGGLTRTSSGMLAMSPQGEWLDIENVNAGGGKGLRVIRYRDAGSAPAVPASIQAALAGRSLALNAARIAAGAPVEASAVVEAARRVDTDVVEAYLAERGQAFQLDARQLVSLADAGLPGRVTDMMVALTYPNKYVLDRAPGMEPRVVAELVDTPGTYGASNRVGYGVGPGYSRYGWAFDPYWSRYGYYYPYGYGYSPYGYDYNLYGYGTYGYGVNVYGRYGYNPFGFRGGYPYVIVTRGSTPSLPPGTVVNGHGYTRNGQTSGGSASRAPTRSSGGSGRRSAAPRSSGSGRTARGRP